MIGLHPAVLYSLQILQLPLIFFLALLTQQAFRITRRATFLWLSIGFVFNLVYVALASCIKFSIIAWNLRLPINGEALTSALSLLGLTCFFQSAVVAVIPSGLHYHRFGSVSPLRIVSALQKSLPIHIVVYVIFGLLLGTYAFGSNFVNSKVLAIADGISACLSFGTLALMALLLHVEGEKFKIGVFFSLGFLLWSLVQFNQQPSDLHRALGFSVSLAAKALLLVGFSRYFVLYAKTAIISEAAAVRAEESRLESEQMTARYVDVLRTLFHEISNPLAALRTSVETLTQPEAGIPRQLRTVVLGLENNFERAQAIIRVGMQTYYGEFRDASDSQDYNRIVPSALNVVQINTFIEFAIKAFIKEYRIKPFEAYYGSKCSVFCSPLEMMQVFTNLFKNAFEAMPLGSPPTIVVRTYVTRQETPEGLKREVVCEVEDFGPGIALELLDKIWARDFSTKQVTESNVVRGRGLYIAKHIIEKYGGRITVQSPVKPSSGSEHDGAKFTLYLPHAHREG